MQLSVGSFGQQLRSVSFGQHQLPSELRPISGSLNTYNNNTVISDLLAPEQIAQQLEALDSYRINITNRAEAADGEHSNFYTEIHQNNKFYLKSQNTISPNTSIQYYNQERWVEQVDQDCTSYQLQQESAAQRIDQQRNIAFASLLGMFSLGEFQLIGSNQQINHQPTDLYQLDTQMPGVRAQSRVWITPDGLILKLEAQLSTEELTLYQSYHLETAPTNLVPFTCQ